MKEKFKETVDNGSADATESKNNKKCNHITLQEVSDLVKCRTGITIQPTSCSRFVTIVRYKHIESFLRSLYEKGFAKFPVSSVAMKSSGMTLVLIWNVEY